MNQRNAPRRHFFVSKSNLLCISIGIALAALVVLPLFTISSASPSQKFSPGNLSSVAAMSSRQAAGIVNPIFHQEAVVPFMTFLPQAEFIPESVATYDGTCTTPKESFAVGEMACAKAVGTLLGPGRIYWVNSQGEALQTDTISPTSPTATWVVSATGNWKVYLSDFDSLRALARFGASDPQVPSVDLSVSNSIIHGADFVAGALVEYEVKVINNGPDTAVNVELTQAFPNNASLLSSSQDSGPVFECEDSSTNTTCDLASLASGASASFTFIYRLAGGTPEGTLIANTATVTSETSELHAPDNTALAEATVIAGAAPASCTLDCPNNITVAADPSQNGAIVSFASAEGFGDCGSISPSQPSGSFFPVGETTVVVTSSAGGGGCSFTVTVVTDGAPSIECPANQVVTAPANSSEATVDPGAPTTIPSDGVSVSGVRADSQLLDAPYPVGTTLITWTATADSGLSSTCTQRITVNANACAIDTENPSITAPDDVSVTTPDNTIGSCGFVVGESELGTANATDNCTVTFARTGVPAGNFFPVGTTIITYTATDGVGRTATDTQTVTVIDGSAPVIAAPADASYVCLSEVPAAHPSQATHGDVLDENGNPLPPGPPIDNCGTPTVTVTESSTGAGSAASPLIITRTYTATDAAGNSASDSQTITVIDDTAPTITLTGANPLVVECHTSYTDPGATATDNCNGSFAATPSGSVNVNTPGTYSITYNATDAAGNAATPVTRTVTVVDTTAPMITLNGPASVTVECHTSYGDAAATAADSCDATVPVTTSGSVDVNTVGTYTLTYNATDDSGNNATATRTVNVVDTSLPSITFNSLTLFFNNLTIVFNQNTVTINGQTYPYNGVSFTHGDLTFSFNGQTITINGNTYTLEGKTLVLWTPLHQYQNVKVEDLILNASDSCDSGLSRDNVVISQVTSDEAANTAGNDDGNTPIDIVISPDCKSVQLRAERANSGNGRFYTITSKATDALGNTRTVTSTIRVRRYPFQAAVDSGPQYTVTGSCP